jgi:hypothetical protein
MRLSLALGCLLLVGCTGPHSTGALWAQRDIDQETLLFRLSDVQRADRVLAVELGLADETLAAERARIESGLSDCPGQGRDQTSLAPSIGDKSRDTVRIQASDEPARLASLAQIALADWRLRRARGTGEVHFCDAARQALAGGTPPTTGPDVLSGLGTATVSRDPSHPSVVAAGWPASAALSSYALGYVDTVQAAAPLPQYLAAVYGGVLQQSPMAPALNGAAPESLVDQLAPAYPDWEPDALYAVFASAR